MTTAPVAQAQGPESSRRTMPMTRPPRPFLSRGLVMDWQLRDRGFLPTPDPLQRLPAGSANAAEELGRDLPELVAGRQFRDVAPERLRGVADANVSNGPEAERLFLLYSYFASAYV